MNVRNAFIHRMPCSIISHQSDVARVHISGDATSVTSNSITAIPLERIAKLTIIDAVPSVAKIPVIVFC